LCKENRGCGKFKRKTELLKNSNPGFELPGIIIEVFGLKKGENADLIVKEFIYYLIQKK
jgi:hypothetical protein